MAKKRGPNPNAGRKKSTDPKDRITLFIPHSIIIGKGNTPMDKTSPEYKAKLEEMVKMLYETVEFLKNPA